jgi:hypothetical protein
MRWWKTFQEKHRKVWRIERLLLVSCVLFVLAVSEIFLSVLWILFIFVESLLIFL